VKSSAFAEKDRGMLESVHAIPKETIPGTLKKGRLSCDLFDCDFF